MSGLRRVPRVALSTAGVIAATLAIWSALPAASQPAAPPRRAPSPETAPTAPTAPAAPTARTRPWTPPRTADGQYDLQGTWVSRTATPLERPAALAGRTRLTDDEVAELTRRAARIFGSGNADFAAGDAFFLAAWENRPTFTSVTATHGAEEMTEREFDHHTSLVIDPADGRIPPLTPAAQRRRDLAAAAGQRPDGPEHLNNALRCIAWGVPRLGGRYGAGDYGFAQIVQSPGFVAIHFEIGHETRIIPLDGRPHPPAHVRFWNGDSRGRWDGATLVVDTTNFSEKSNVLGAAEGLHLVERFTRVSPDTITYQMTFDDPATWTRPWTAEMPLKQSSERLYEYGCHEGNQEIVAGILRATRADERAGR